MSKNTEITVVAEPATPKSAAASIPAIVEATVQIPVDKPQDPLPRIIITGPDRTISQVALEIGQILASCGIYLFGGEPAILDPATQALVPVKPGVFRTWLEQYLVPLKQTKDDVERKTMSNGDASTILQSPQFRQQLREVERVHHALQPVIRSNGDVELLPPGYDRESKILTVGRDLEYDTRLPLDKAKEFLIRLFRDFPFADKERSLAVALAAMLTVYGLSILPPKTIVPAFKFGGNQPGLGKGLLAQIAIVPVLGFAPTGVSPKDETEMRKLLFATAREGRLVVFFDNVTGRLASPSLESFLTTSTVAGRLLGTSVTLNCKKQAVVFITGNGLTQNQDMARRTLVAELFLDEPPSTRVIENQLDENRILELRPDILASLHALVREWHAAGQPPPSLVNPNFTGWSNVIGSIVAHAGFGDVTMPVPAVQDLGTKEADVAKLIALLHEEHRTEAITFTRLVEIARENDLFADILKSPSGETDRQERTALGRLFTALNERVFTGGIRFVCIGTGHTRRYAVRRVTGGDDAA